MATLHGFICECTDPRCRNRIRMTEEQHVQLRRHGTIVSSKCRDAYGRRIVGRGTGYVVLATSTARAAA